MKLRSYQTEMVDAIRQSAEKGSKLGVNSTPSFFVNGTLQKGAMSFEEFDKLLKPMTGG